VRHIRRWGIIGVLVGLLVVLAGPVWAGGGRPFGVAARGGHGVGRHHGSGGPVVILGTPPVFVPALGGGPVLLLQAPVIVTPGPVVVQPRHLIWVPGQWRWTGSSWVWIPGHWR